MKQKEFRSLDRNPFPNLSDKDMSLLLNFQILSNVF